MSERIKIDDTYTYAYDDGHVQLLRNGLPWLGEEPGGFPGSKAWISAANEIESLRANIAELEARPAQIETSPERGEERMPSELALREYLVRAKCDSEQCAAFIQTFQDAVARFEADVRADERAKRLDQDQVKKAMHAHRCVRADVERGVTVFRCHCGWSGREQAFANHRADAVLALEPTREVSRG
ncbi:hypothetical protein [Pseudoclavibacter sp. VKM Ac-2867]|uniref:hypothetical protein n=1 Tax=Pseudoclavibacter sp. VKM Ac-2867 TaxID=2783829 RepID=UPI00188A44BD|nr:hypothetical protein [Pseudoclavibacter sp. VKM Ac-2867]MBF4459505.1 hypothetical protein [Pseudoclavibacter sp. VKM Ac-2867]